MISRYSGSLKFFPGLVGCLCLFGSVLFSQSQKVESERKTTSEHEDSILGVTLGMDVPTALQLVFVNAHRNPGQEKPDAKKVEGPDKKDVRVLYAGLAVGDLQIAFAEGKFVREIVLDYALKPVFSDLQLAPSGSIGSVQGGERYDDRYSVGYTNENGPNKQRVWYRDAKTPLGFSERIEFISGKRPDDAIGEGKLIVRKMILVTPGDEKKFLAAMAAK